MTIRQFKTSATTQCPFGSKYQQLLTPYERKKERKKKTKTKMALSLLHTFAVAVLRDAFGQLPYTRVNKRNWLRIVY